VEPSREFFVSNLTRRDYSNAADILRPVSGGGCAEASLTGLGLAVDGEGRQG
jgi:hypothetical protein